MGARSVAVCLALAVGLPRAGAQPPSAPAGRIGKEGRVLANLTGGACGVAFSPDGKRLAAAGGGDNVIRVWDLATGKEALRLTGLRGFVRSVTFSRDGKLLASAGDDQGVVLWDAATGKELRRVGKHNNGLRIAAFSPDGKTLASSGFDEHIGLWDVASGKQLRSWETPCKCIYSVAFAPDGRLVAGAGGDGTARIWEAATGKEVRRLPGHKNGTVKVAFSPDGRTLAVASHDETVHLWELRTGREIRRFGNYRGWVWGLAYAPTGRALASAGQDGQVVLWELGPPAAPGRPRELTAAELDGAWRDLAAADGGTAFDARLALEAAPPKQVVPYLGQRLKPAAAASADAATVDRLVRELDHRLFKVRERAQRELEKLGTVAGPAIRKALAGAPSLDARRRLEALAAKLDAKEVPPERLRELRALGVLEQMDTPETRKLLKALAGGAPGDSLTEEAATVLARLVQRRPKQP